MKLLPWLLVLVAGYEVRDAYDRGSWRLAIMAAFLLVLAWLGRMSRKEAEEVVGGPRG